jgi:subtilase family serine protease
VRIPSILLPRVPTRGAGVLCGVLGLILVCGAASSEAAPQAGFSRACPPSAQVATCGALIASTAAGPTADGSPDGYGPADLAAAYNVPSSTVSSSRPTVAVVVAYDDPTAEADLNTYRQAYGLPPCRSVDGCFAKVTGDGAARLPAFDASWTLEASLDLDMVSAACPSCRILLVEGREASVRTLARAAARAARMADVVSNSYGAPETSRDVSAGASALAGYYRSDHATMVAATGDAGYGAQFPASVAEVVAVGGTTLQKAPDTGRGWTESAWFLSGGGCSTLFAKPAWQRDSGCAGRTTADMSAVADPGTGVAVFVGTMPDGTARWLVVGGTSAAAAYVSGLYGLARSTGGLTPSPGAAYSAPQGFFDITDGPVGWCDPLPTYVCTAGAGYDGPTGLGSPNGLAGLQR